MTIIFKYQYFKNILTIFFASDNILSNLSGDNMFNIKNSNYVLNIFNKDF